MGSKKVIECPVCLEDVPRNTTTKLKSMGRVCSTHKEFIINHKRELRVKPMERKEEFTEAPRLTPGILLQESVPDSIQEGDKLTSRFDTVGPCYIKDEEDSPKFTGIDEGSNKDDLMKNQIPSQTLENEVSNDTASNEPEYQDYIDTTLLEGHPESHCQVMNDETEELSDMSICQVCIDTIDEDLEDGSYEEAVMSIPVILDEEEIDNQSTSGGLEVLDNITVEETISPILQGTIDTIKHVSEQKDWSIKVTFNRLCNAVKYNYSLSSKERRESIKLLDQALEMLEKV